MHVHRSAPPCEIRSEMLVTVRVGFTTVQFAFGHPASAPVTVKGAQSVSSGSSRR
jgi:hypothetical protein